MAAVMAVPVEDAAIPLPTVLHILVVGFHHQKGSTVEFAYPPLVEVGHLQEAQSITSLLPSSWKHLPYIALPDGCHNYEKDSVYFTLPSTSRVHRPVFGVACCRQVEAKELVSVDKDITRSSIQKSVCVLSSCPVFGFIEAKLSLITHAYFNSKDFSDTTILEEAYKNLNATLTVESAKHVVNVGLSPKKLVHQFQHRLLQIFKALLLQKRVLVYGSPAENVCTAVLSIASLFPNELESLTASLDHRDDLGFPLGVFPNATALQPYVCLQQMELIASGSTPWLLVGVVNPLFEKQRDKVCDVFVNLCDGLITVHDADLKSSLHLTSADLRFCSLLDESIQESDGQGTHRAHYSDWHGSNEWVLMQFKLYLLSMLATSLSETQTVQPMDDFCPEFTMPWLKGTIFGSWKDKLEMYESVKKYEPGHICASKGGVSLSDIRRRIVAQASDYGVSVRSKKQAGGEEHALVSQTVSRVSTTVGSLWSGASSTLYSWWTANKDEKN